ncbi:NAD-dependent epimerase [Terrihabitans soli]|uniref:NAD-dependent epimerase n=1 Tax=Terrihabitans soli TaxID=708113 RepID=A0A6S6QKS3_9HYPH|nr:SDR family oxidoreductase [Terrihabitans soli]BCJ91913.1 NAD-dependent epimerase [Terrihabitans soli]
MRILINGNMGYIGPVVAAHLRHAFPDATLIGLDAAWFAHCLTSASGLPETALDEQHFGDLRTWSAEEIGRYDAIVHLAAVSNDPMGKKFETVTDEINHRTTVEVAKLAAGAGVKNFVFASSCSIYGFAASGVPRTEKDPTDPLTAYARSKIATEVALAALPKHNMTVTCLRFATACGMSPRLRLDLVLNDLVAGALVARQITVLSDGSPWRPLIHVRDMARAIEWAITRSPQNGGQMLVVNAGSDRWNYQVLDLANAVKARFPDAELSINKDAPPDKRSYKVDFALFRQLAPDHQPIETLEGAIAELADRLAELDFADTDYRNSQLIRLKVLERHIARGQLTDDLLPAAGTPMRTAAQ